MPVHRFAEHRRKWIDKFAVSLKQLAKTFLKLEEKKQTFSEEEIDEMFACVREEVCEKCEREFPERAEGLFTRNEDAAKERYEHLTKLIDLYDKQ